MKDRTARAILDEGWRSSPLVVSYPEQGDRGRMRGSSAYPTATLHRPTCRTLSRAARAAAMNPSNVYSETLAQFRETADKAGVGNQYKVCQLCCRDVEVKGRNMVPRGTKQTADEVLTEIAIARQDEIQLNAAREKLQMAAVKYYETSINPLKPNAKIAAKFADELEAAAVALSHALGVKVKQG